MEQLIIIGAGASGLAAAVTASAMGITHIALLERLPKAGKKILATGNGRCNLSHTGITPADYAGSVDPSSVLRAFGNAGDFFEELGLYCRTDAQGRMYPYSMTAGSVLDALQLQLAQNGVEIRCEQEVISLRRHGKLWRAQTADASYEAPAVIFAAGGHAAPKLGTDGSAWGLLSELGLSLNAPRPILCPVLSDAKQLYPLKGIRLRADVTLLEHGKPLRTESGELQFSEKALSGICVFNLSPLIDPGRFDSYALSVNCIPEEIPEDTLSRLYAMQGIRCGADCEGMLSGLLQRPVARHVLKTLGIPAAMPCAALDSRQLNQLAQRLHSLPFCVTGLADFSKAQATAGGVPGDVLEASLQVKGHPGLYVTGEAADIHAACGGYHLHWAWSSGCAAARHAAAHLGGSL